MSIGYMKNTKNLIKLAIKWKDGQPLYFNPYNKTFIVRYENALINVSHQILDTALATVNAAYYYAN